MKHTLVATLFCFVCRFFLKEKEKDRVIELMDTCVSVSANETSENEKTAFLRNQNNKQKVMN